MAGKKLSKPTWIRYSSVGVEFVAALAGFTLVGFWVDHHYDCGPWGLTIGAGLGLVGGTYNLIRVSLAAFKEPGVGNASKDDKERGSKP